MSEVDGPEAGWYADPTSSDRIRYWDGGRWTDDVRDALSSVSDRPSRLGTTLGPAVDSEAVTTPASQPVATSDVVAVVPPRLPRWTVPGVLGLAVILGLFGWFLGASTFETDDGQTVTDPRETRSPAEADVNEDAISGGTVVPGQLLLGSLLPETGGQNHAGLPLISAVQMAVAEINAAGGVLGNPIGLVIADGAEESGRNAAGANRLLAAGVQAIIGFSQRSSSTQPVLDTITSAGVVKCVPGNYDPGFEVYPDRGFVFTTTPNWYDFPHLAFALVVLESGARSVALAAEDGERFMMRQIAANIQSWGGTVAIEEVYSESVDSATRALLASGADTYVLLPSSFDDRHDRLVLGLLAAGVRPSQIFGNSRFDPGSSELLSSPSAPPLDGLTYIKMMRGRSTLEFETRLRVFEPNFSGSSLFASSAYDCVNLIALAAIQGGSTDSQVIRDNMISVSTGDTVCATFAECLSFLGEGRTIAYQSVDGIKLNLQEVREGGGDASVGGFEIYKWVGSSSVLQRQIEINLAR